MDAQAPESRSFPRVGMLSSCITKADTETFWEGFFVQDGSMSHCGNEEQRHCQTLWFYVPQAWSRGQHLPSVSC